jgi:hypothetical protein
MQELLTFWQRGIMTDLDDLRRQLRELDDAEEKIHQERAAVLRAFVKTAGGVTEAAGQLNMDPRTVVQNQRRDEVAMVIYRGTDALRFDDQGRPYGEIGEGAASEIQRRADSEFWRIAKAMRPKIKLLIVVVRGKVHRIWPVMPAATWKEENGKVALPLGEQPLKPEEIRTQYPALGIAEGDHLPTRQGKMREYVPIDGNPDTTTGEQQRRQA